MGGVMPLAALIVISAPVAILVLALFLNNAYSEKLFGLNWPGHDLNNPGDPRFVRLNLKSPKPPED
jgi:hypothetical protein